MKKKSLLKKIVYVILALILAIPVLISVFGGKALKAGIETAASKTLKVNVTVEDVSLSILKGSVELENLIIPNLEGYENPNLLEAGKAKVDVGLKSLMSDTVEIDDMIFNDITVVIEQKGLTNNLKELLKSLPKPDEKPDDKTDDKEKAEKNLLIKNLEMNNITVKIKLIPLPGKADTIPLKLAPIKMTDLGTDNKMSVAALTAKILGAIAMGVAEQGVGIIPDEIIGPIKGVLGAGSDAIIEGGKEVIKGAGEVLKGAGDAGKDISDGIKGLFKKKD
ncbi:MAG: hypothetical protein K9M75_08735 [Phycisphaerae bacterium]|nr:hypothetical protein [Phycisphaerae bacterium]